jgi:hypothetical protein
MALNNASRDNDFIDKELHGFIPQANYTDRTTAAYQRS